METDEILHLPISKIFETYPVALDFFKSFGLEYKDNEQSFLQTIEPLTDDYWELYGTNKEELISTFTDFIIGISNFTAVQKVETLEVIAGVDKSGKHEECSLFLRPGEITCIVGPTGSGKSRLLSDIEWLANTDTPTKRKVLINGKLPDDDFKNSVGGKLVAQITQNMNFVLDLNVYDFLILHAQSRFLDNPEHKVTEVIALANELCGEKFSPDTPLTFLSGGQSRALMIADVACIGQAPIVLIDEIENAGVDKKKALELLVNKEKIVLMATHDPLLILLADQRVIINNGGMSKLLFTSESERKYYHKLEELDSTIQAARQFFRMGGELSCNDD
ncbi:MAG: ATP-binding cassette domain-containing protein [Bacteroidales bacterium]|nr:ATP-binding cassette domain-containing protein [Bacteroidales bacterium]